MEGPSLYMPADEIIDKLNRTMDTEGWKEIILPRLKRLRDVKYNTMLTTQGPLTDFARGELVTIEWFLAHKKWVEDLAANEELEKERQAELKKQNSQEPFKY